MQTPEYKIVRLLSSYIPGLLEEFNADPAKVREVLQAMCASDVIWDAYARLRLMGDEAGAAGLKAVGVDVEALGVKEPVRQ